MVAPRLAPQPRRAALRRAGAAAVPDAGLVLGQRRPVALRQPAVALAPDLSRASEVGLRPIRSLTASGRQGHQRRVVTVPLDSARPYNSPVSRDQGESGRFTT